MKQSFFYPVRLAAILLSLILIVHILDCLQIVVVPILFSIIFSVMLFPLVIRLEKWGLPKGIATFCSIIIATILLSVIVYFLSTQIIGFVKSGNHLNDRFNYLLNNTQLYITKHFGIEKAVQTQQIKNQLSKLVDNSTVAMVSFFSFTSSFIADIALIPLYVFFLLYYRHFFLEFFYKVFPQQDKVLIDETLDKIHGVVYSWLSGLSLVMLIVGTLNSVALLIIGVQNAIFFGFLAAFLLVIPYIGIVIGALLPAIVALITKDNSWSAIAVLASFWCIQKLEANIITPNIVGGKVSLNPLISIVMLFLFGKLFGLSGLILALPLTAILKVICDTVPALKPYGFILGTAKPYHLKKNARSYLKHLQALKRKKKLAVEEA